MNILINDYCNLKCPYCFAENVMEEAKCNPVRSMTIDNLKIVLDFLYKNNEKCPRLLGGEPTIHPQFKEIINLIVEDDRFNSIMLFSNAVFDEDTLKFLIDTSKKKRINMLPNCNEEKIIGTERYNRMKHNILELAKHNIVGSVGINIYDPNMDIDYIFDLAIKSNVPRVRWSITVPNRTLDKDFDVIEHFASYKKLLTYFFDKATEYNKITGIDCNGIPICSLDPELYKLIKMMAPHEIKKSACGNIFDIKPNLDVIRCFGMSDGLVIKLTDYNSLQDMGKAFDECFMDIIKKPLIEKCKTCPTYKKSGNKACSCLQYRKEK